MGHRRVLASPPPPPIYALLRYRGPDFKRIHEAMEGRLVVDDLSIFPTFG